MSRLTTSSGDHIKTVRVFSIATSAHSHELRRAVDEDGHVGHHEHQDEEKEGQIALKGGGRGFSHGHQRSIICLLGGSGVV